MKSLNSDQLKVYIWFCVQQTIILASCSFVIIFTVSQTDSVKLEKPVIQLQLDQLTDSF